MSICCFTGHRRIEDAVMDPLTDLLDEKIEALIAEGVTDFRTGGALGFDTLAAIRVLMARATHPECKLHLVLPCPDQDARWNARDRSIYRHILERADSVTYVGNAPTAWWMYARNRALVDGADLVIAYQTSAKGGTAYTCNYAATHGVRVINLFEELK